MRDKRKPEGFPRRAPIQKAHPDALTWPEDLLGRCARITAIGCHRLLVENHTGLLCLTETEIRLNTGCGPLSISGEGLTLCDARPRAMIVKGRIRRIDLPLEGGGA